jgi:glutathione S-transferase
MNLVFHGHPLSSFCWKVLIALYENGTPFEFRQLNNLGDPVERAAYAALWPIAKMPLLVDEGRGEVVPETSIIIEYLDLHHPGPTRFVPEDPDAARETRFWDRICDLYLEVPMQRIVFDRLRGEGQHEPQTVAESRALLATALGYVEQRMQAREWLAGDSFGLADCAAAPGLFYADKVMPFGADLPNCALYLERLKARPSFARVLTEAEPWFQYFPQG